MTSPLAGALTVVSEAGLQKRIGTVATTSPLVVTTPNGALNATSYSTSYVPRYGDVVLCLVDAAGNAIVAFRIDGSPVDPWHNLTPAAGWSNRGGGYTPLRYRRNDAMGGVLIQGVMAAPAAPSGTLVGTLPYSFTYINSFPVASTAGASSTGSIEVYTDGTMKAWNLGSTAFVIINGFASFT